MIYIWLEERIHFKKYQRISNLGSRVSTPGNGEPFCHPLAQNFIKAVTDSLGILFEGGYVEYIGDQARQCGRKGVTP